MPIKKNTLPGYRNASLVACFIWMAFMLCGNVVFAQFTQPPPPGTPGSIQRDTTLNKTNTSDWEHENARVLYKYLNSNKLHTPDTSIHTFHRRPFSQPWYRDLGNSGTPARNLLFTPENRVGPTLGYHVFDVYRFDVDSLKYYNTNRPYSFFKFQLGSKLEQMAEIMHTQNVRPNWNFSFHYRKINSPGYYQLQRANNDNFNFTTYYQSKNLHYELYGGLIYNRQQQDENGGIVNDSLLLDENYNERRTIPVRFAAASAQTSVPRSTVVNLLRDFTVFVQHGYTFGRTDTLYNEDSTKFSLQITPRFGLTHRFNVSTSKHRYKDTRPDSLRYIDFFNRGFLQTDSVFSQQQWLKVDNAVMLNGFLGKRQNQVLFSAGLGIRSDRFRNKFVIDSNTINITSNYFIGELKKEALEAGKWFYNANAIFYLTGDAAGSSVLNASLGKDIKNIGNILIGAKQEINIAPFNYSIYYNQFDTISATFSKESVTTLFVTLESARLGVTVGARSYLISNYIYLNQKQLPAQYAPSFNIAQLWARKIFRWRSLVFDNELAYQQYTAGAPVNIPLLLGRHQLSIEKQVFGSALRIATGIEVRYHSPYSTAGYSPFFNRFYYQNTYLVSNDPEGSVFFNFRIKNFRAYLMGDQVQQLFAKNAIVSQGYATQNFMIRFGFVWALMN
jgi:hypothetical protein